MPNIKVLIHLVIIVSCVRYGKFKSDRVAVIKRSIPDYNHQIPVNLKIYHGLKKTEITSTVEENGEHTSHIQILFEVDGKTLILDIQLSKQLIHKGFFQIHQKNGEDIVTRPTSQEVNLCHYNGKILGQPKSWVALSTCDGLSGVIFDGDKQYFIKRHMHDTGLSKTAYDHVLYTYSDLTKYNYTSDGLEEKDANDGLDYTQRLKRTADQQKIMGGIYNSNQDSSYIELVLVLDNGVFRKLGENKTRASNYAKSVANIVNGIYSELNIFVALVGIVIWTEKDEIDYSADSALSEFSKYSETKLRTVHLFDAAELIAAVPIFGGGVFGGKAYVNTICAHNSVGMCDYVSENSIGPIMAHEIAHNLGLRHDGCSECCPQFLINGIFSACSIAKLKLFRARGKHYCLMNKPEYLFDGPVCGNGFVEQGEQCDCGLPTYCNNTCCNATTCMLTTNSTCGTGDCCDLKTCQFKNVATLCRATDNECDLSEFCTGSSEFCPSNTYKLDTEPCDANKSHCHQGVCLASADFCTGRKMMSYEECYKVDLNQSKNMNHCRINLFSDTTFTCSKVTRWFSTCSQPTFERIQFGADSVVIFARIFGREDSIISCTTAMLGLAENVTPDISLCNKNEILCRTMSSLRKELPVCPQDCNGFGWCNNKGHCHCMDGSAPPYCDRPGAGGSIDSGPISDPNAFQGIISVIFIIFLGVVPAVAITSLAIFCLFQYMRYGRFY